MKKFLDRHKLNILTVIGLVAFLFLIILSFNVAYGDESSAKKGTADFQHSKIGVVTGTVQETTALQIFPEADIMRYQTISDIALAVQGKKVDCGIVSETMKDPLCKEYNGLVTSDDLFIEGDVGYTFPKDSKLDTVLSDFNTFLAKFKQSGKLKEIYDKWFHSDDESTKKLEDVDLTGTKGSIHIYTAAQNEPWEFYSGGDIIGFDVDVINAFCKDMGYTYNMEDVNFDSLIMSVSTGKADMGLCGTTITEERKQSVRFTDPIVTTNSTIIYKDDSAVTQTSFIDYVKDGFEKTFLREDRWKLIVDGLVATLIITLLAALIGTFLGFIIALLRLKSNGIVNKILTCYIKLFQGLPVLVVLLIFYYIVFGNSSINPILIAALVFGLDNAAFVSEAVKSGIESVDSGQSEAAISLGFTKRQAFMKFILPQAAQNFLPNYRGLIISLLKGTSVVGYIAIQDLTKAGDIIRSRTYDAFFPLITVAIVYFIVAYVITKLLSLLEKNLNKKGK